MDVFGSLYYSLSMVFVVLRQVVEVAFYLLGILAFLKYLRRS